VIWAALDTDHWGAKLQRSKDQGESWEDIELPSYPDDAEAATGVPASLDYIWLVATGHADKPNRLYLGTEPGGLFQSDDAGDSFQLVEGLWNHPSRMKHWFGGGRDYAGLHSVVADPGDPDRMLVGISVAGVFESLDDGKSWQPRNNGLTADYLPNPHGEVGHDQLNSVFPLSLTRKILKQPGWSQRLAMRNALQLTVLCVSHERMMGDKTGQCFGKACRKLAVTMSYFDTHLIKAVTC
jgi:hypothetical protein